ncbi:hypothetical protein EJ110_NYTH12362 [Nymphaea thermarum]|nr:hypothetical protein EJ110_NYTH12362 [Nymphaea thermarum]
MLALTLERLIYVINKPFPTLGDKPTDGEKKEYEAFENEDLMAKTIMKSDGKFKGNFAGTPRTQGTVVKCYRCGKPGHVKKNCRTYFLNKKDRKSQNNKNKGKDHEDYNEEVICVVSECLFADGDLTGWWVDSGATRHIAKTKEGMIRMENLSLGMQKSDNEPTGDQSDNESIEEQSGNEPTGDESGNEPTGEQSGNEPTVDQFNNKPSKHELPGVQSGNEPIGDQLGNEPTEHQLSEEQYGNEPSGEQLGTASCI